MLADNHVWWLFIISWNPRSLRSLKDSAVKAGSFPRWWQSRSNLLGSHSSKAWRRPGVSWGCVGCSPENTARPRKVLGYFMLFQQKKIWWAMVSPWDLGSPMSWDSRNHPKGSQWELRTWAVLPFSRQIHKISHHSDCDVLWEKDGPDRNLLRFILLNSIYRII